MVLAEQKLELDTTKKEGANQTMIGETFKKNVNESGCYEVIGRLLKLLIKNIGTVGTKPSHHMEKEEKVHQLQH